MFAGVRHLEPDTGFASIVRLKLEWWDLSRQQTEERVDGWTERINTLLDDSVRLQLRCDVAFGAFLSGGVDSSTVVHDESSFDGSSSYVFYRFQ